MTVKARGFGSGGRAGSGCPSLVEYDMLASGRANGEGGGARMCPERSTVERSASRRDSPALQPTVAVRGLKDRLRSVHEYVTGVHHPAKELCWSRPGSFSRRGRTH